MNDYEALSLLVSVVALVISVVSLYIVQKQSEKDFRIILSITGGSLEVKTWRNRKKGYTFNYSGFIVNSGLKPVHILGVSYYVGEDILRVKTISQMRRIGGVLKGAFVLESGGKRKISTKMPWWFIEEKKDFLGLKEFFFHIEILYTDFNGRGRAAYLDCGGLGPGKRYLPIRFNEVIVAPHPNYWQKGRVIQKRQ